MLHDVRAFTRGSAVSALAAPGDDVLPAMLHRFRDPAHLRYDYPMVLYPAGGDRLAEPVTQSLRDFVEGFAPGEDSARILKDNLPRLELAVRQDLGDRIDPVDARSVLRPASALIVEQLALNEESSARLRADLDKLIEAYPEGSMLLAMSERAPVHLMVHVLRHRMTAHRATCHESAGKLRAKLGDLLRVDRARSSEARTPEALRDSMGVSGTAHIDPQAMAKMLGPVRGPEPMPPKRRERVEHAYEVLDRFFCGMDAPVAGIVHDGALGGDWPESDDINIIEADDPCTAALRLFDKQAQEHTELHRTIRIAELEAEGRYEDAIHDPFVASFDWRSFSKEELLRLPAIVVVMSASRLAGTNMVALSRLMLSGRPIRVLCLVAPADNPISGLGEGVGSHFELGYMGISHREALVHHASAARPLHLIDCCGVSIDAVHPALHVIASGLCADGSEPRLGSWLHAGAALEGRAHPFFSYNPEAGSTWASRMDFTGNPEPESDWPIGELEMGEGGAMSLAFTFADFALMEPGLRAHYRVVPDGCPLDDLVTIDEYLSLEPEEALRRIPYVWGANGDGALVRLVVSREMVELCRDRLDYWHTLQELAGVGNEYVREAVERAKAEAAEEAKAQRQELESAHAAELDRVREEAGGDAMRKLAAVLLDMDLTTAVGAASASQAPAPSPVPVTEEPAEAATAEPPPPEPEEEEEDVGFDDPFIDSALCTTCNDCVELNGMMFVYNDNKQAMIGDPDAGTFAQLVIAAEKCPAKCIHPGKPRKPDEPNLPELIERAKPFN